MANLKKLLEKIDPNPVSSGSVARAFRKNLEMTLMDVERISGIRESNLSAYENGRKEMTKGTAEILGAVYGIEPWLILFPNGRDARDERVIDVERKAKKFFASRIERLRAPGVRSAGSGNKKKAKR